ncbi:hypothetical protein IFR05_008937 [Cadophora sp. M221]|nr:hypothetical protein IFR05_008937 [Cadophora sp. M221]
MGKNTKKVAAFIESIPNAKLEGLTRLGGTIFKDTDFRLDMQGMTTGRPRMHNLQVQINRETTITSLKKAAPQTVASLLVEEENPGTPAEIKQGLIASILI